MFNSVTTNNLLISRIMKSKKKGGKGGKGGKGC
jgi:hypothetical protein